MDNAQKEELTLLRQYYEVVEETNIISKTDLKGKIIYANKKFLEISGYSEKELLGNPHNIVRNPDMPSSVFKDLWKTIQSKKVWQGVVTNLRKDGTKYTVDASIFPILDTNDNIIEYIAIRHDITQVLELKHQVEDLHTYNAEQEKIALEKLNAGITNHLSEDTCTVLYTPSDILSGDFYSIYKLKNGATLVYILDGQGHGASPALTVFAISSILNQAVNEINTIDELIAKLVPSVRMFLGEIEQLSYTMMMISDDNKTMTYSSGGMYPFLVKIGDEVLKFKANNNPLMNFSSKPVVSTVDIGNWESIILYSDGLVEHEIEELGNYKPEALINEPFKIKEAISEISSYKLEDDVTMIYLKNA